jgi:hypothetical protein
MDDSFQLDVDECVDLVLPPSSIRLMTLRRGQAAMIALLCGLEFWGGCGPRRLHNIPDGYAVIQEHIADSPHNLPPIRNELDFVILEVDGAPFKRETSPRLVDMQPGALVTAGTHRIRARVMPMLHRPGDQPTEMSFFVTVVSGKAYFLVAKDKLPVLVEENLTR